MPTTEWLNKYKSIIEELWQYLTRKDNPYGTTR